MSPFAGLGYLKVDVFRIAAGFQSPDRIKDIGKCRGSHLSRCLCECDLGRMSQSRPQRMVFSTCSPCPPSKEGAGVGAGGLCGRDPTPSRCRVPTCALSGHGTVHFFRRDWVCKFALQGVNTPSGSGNPPAPIKNCKNPKPFLIRGQCRLGDQLDAKNKCHWKSPRSRTNLRVGPTQNQQSR